MIRNRPSDFEENTMNDNRIRVQYATGLSRRNIEQALVAAGKDLSTHLRPADLGPLEDFHTMGRIATNQLVDLIEMTRDDEVLDAGSGIGGTSRFVAEKCQCRVSAVDLTEEYCDTARWLNRLVALGDRISVRRADVTDLPFADATFQVVFSQHVQMNVADKARLYQEARRVLAGGGRLAMWDITSGGLADPNYPLPWADQPDLTHLATPNQLRSVVESAGFVVEHWNDLTDLAASTMQIFLGLPPNPLGLHAFVPNFAEKAQNFTRALSDGRLRAIQAVAHAVA
jgi:sarcosine/dimethylglycine N-methyltransferase